MFSEKLDFENRDKPKLTLVLENLDNQELDIWMERNVSLSKHFSTRVTFFILALIEEVKPLVAAKKSLKIGIFH